MAGNVGKIIRRNPVAGLRFLTSWSGNLRANIGGDGPPPRQQKNRAKPLPIAATIGVNSEYVYSSNDRFRDGLGDGSSAVTLVRSRPPGRRQAAPVVEQASVFAIPLISSRHRPVFPAARWSRGTSTYFCNIAFSSGSIIGSGMTITTRLPRSGDFKASSALRMASRVIS